jgi:hypothetical protein
MGMAAADEKEILSDRDALLHRLHYARAPSGRRAQLNVGSRSNSLVTGKYCEKADSGRSGDRPPSSK